MLLPACMNTALYVPSPVSVVVCESLDAVSLYYIAPVRAINYRYESYESLYWWYVPGIPAYLHLVPGKVIT